MLVDVVLLRRAGKKLPPEAVRAARPVRGMLQLDYSRHLHGIDPRDKPQLAQLIVPGAAEAALPALLCAEMGPLRNWQFMIVGREDHGTAREPVKAGPRQAWWCRVVREPATLTPRPAPATPQTEACG